LESQSCSKGEEWYVVLYTHGGGAVIVSQDEKGRETGATTRRRRRQREMIETTKTRAFVAMVLAMCWIAAVDGWLRHRSTGRKGVGANNIRPEP